MVYSRTLASAFQKIEKWCKDRSIRIINGNVHGLSFYHPHPPTIELGKGLHARRRLHHLLHECGHHLILQSKNQRWDPANGNPRAKQTRLAMLDEEIEAWYRGSRLAKRLRIPIDRAVWERTKFEYLSTYMLYSLKYEQSG